MNRRTLLKALGLSPLALLGARWFPKKEITREWFPRIISSRWTVNSLIDYERIERWLLSHNGGIRWSTGLAWKSCSFHFFYDEKWLSNGVRWMTTPHTAELFTKEKMRQLTLELAAQTIDEIVDRHEAKRLGRIITWRE